jgi:hypothetical protein
MTRTKSSRALLSVVLAVLMAAAFMPSLTYSSFAATAKKATKVTKLNHTGAKVYGKVGSKYTLKYKLSPSKLTSSAQKTVWKSSDSSVVKVIATRGKHATVKVKSVGTAKITVYTKANTKAKAVWSFKTKEDKTTLTGVTVSAPNAKDPATELKVGTTLQAKAAPEAKDVTYQWYADGTKIDGATSSEFTVTTDQIGKAITVKAKSKNEVESAATAKVSDVTVDNFYIDGTPSVDETLKVKAQAGSPLADLSNDVDQLATVEWHRVTKNDATGNKADVVIGTGASYKVTAADQGSKIYAVVTPNKDLKVATSMSGAKGTTGTTVTAKDGKYTLPETSEVQKATVVSKVVMKADGKELEAGKTTEVKSGTALTAEVTPAAAASALNYQWYKDGYKIDGATSASYTPSEAGEYSVKVSVKSDNVVYSIASDAQCTAKASVAKTYKEFTGVSLVNVTAAKDTTKRTTNLAGDEYGVTVSGLKYNTDYTVAWYKQTTDAYGKVTTPTPLGTDQTYQAASGVLKAGEKIYAVVTGKDKTSYKDYKTTTSTITIDADAATTIAGFTIAPNDAKTAVTTTYKPADGQKIVWQKAPVSEFNLDTTYTDTTTTGSTYELSTAEQKGGFKLRAEIVDANGKVLGYSNTLTVSSTNGTVTIADPATL